MNIVLLVFGNDIKYHIQTYFCILTILKHCSKDSVISLYTDCPEYYVRLNNLIDIIPLDKNKLNLWINDTGYIFRAKIKAIQDSALRNPDKHLLFLDCDTVIYKSLQGILHLLDKGCGVMCNDEGHPSKMKGASLTMWKNLAGERIQNCTVSLKHNVWNSGVIGIPKDKLTDVIGLALEACDFILDKQTGCFTAEQYAFSIAMQENTEVYSAQEWVIHYWGNKYGWTQVAANMLNNSFLKNRTVEEEIQDLDGIDFMSIPYRVKKHLMNKRLCKLVNKIIPDTIFKF